MAALAEFFFNADIIREVWLYLLQGLGFTLLLSAIVIPLGLAGGLAVALVACAPNRIVRGVLICLIDFFRAIPPLVLLIFIYFGSPFAGIDLNKFVAVGLAFTLTTSSYYGEIFRAGIESIPKGVVEAGRSVGLSVFKCMRYVVIPPATRNVLPDLISNTLEVVKMTSLASVVAIPELLYNARQAQALTYNPTPIVLAAILYLVILIPAVRLVARYERRPGQRA